MQSETTDSLLALTEQSLINGFVFGQILEETQPFNE